MTSSNVAAERWLSVHDDLLRGIAHAFSNRIAAMGAASYMHGHGDTPVEQTMETLRVETERMETLLQHLRLLPRRAEAGAEPVMANDACTLAVTLHAHHADLREFPCDIVIAEDVYPVWAEPQAMLHALLVALTTAKRNAPAGSRIQLHVSGTAHVVHFRAEARGAATISSATDDRDAAAAAWLLAPHGGTARTVGDGCCELEVPTLVAARRARKAAATL